MPVTVGHDQYIPEHRGAKSSWSTRERCRNELLFKSITPAPRALPRVCPSTPLSLQKRMEKEGMENLASTYAFHFIGDSTTRRLGESFVSIFTGTGSTHPKAHHDIDFSSGSLKVWAALGACFRHRRQREPVTGTAEASSKLVWLKAR